MAEPKYDIEDADASVAMSAILQVLAAYFQLAHSIDETMQEKHGPLWWAQLLVLGTIEGARENGSGGKLHPTMADNIIELVEAARTGKPLYKTKPRQTGDAPAKAPTHGGTERMQ